MKTIRTLLSIIALCAAALGVAAVTGAVRWNVALVDLLTAGGALLGTFGIAPLVLSAAEHRACAGIAAFAAAVVTAHASGTIPGAPRVFNVIAVGAALLSVLGRWDTPPASAAPVTAKPSPEPPKAA